MKKKLIVGVVIVGGLFILAAGIGLPVLYMSLGKIIKAGVETVGSRVTQCEITVDSIDVALLQGRVEINGMTVGNPEGFKSEYAFRLKHVHVALNPRSIFSEKVLVEDVVIDAPDINCELGKGGSNIWQIKRNVEAFSERFTGPPADGEEEPVEEPPAPEEPGKAFAIDHVLLQDASVQVSTSLLGGRGVKMPLPNVELTGLGTDSKEGATVSDVISAILDDLLKSLNRVIKDSGDILEGTSARLTGAAADLLKDGTSGGREALEGAGDQVREGVGGLLKGARGILGGDKND